MGHKPQARCTHGQARQGPRSPGCAGAAPSSPGSTQSTVAPTERGGEQAVHEDIGVAADGRGEVGVEGHVQGVVAEEGLVLQDAGAEVQGHLEGARREGRRGVRFVDGP